jgi:uncharacterized membrane protein YphA (DoxX/SURF4 family)
MKLAVTIARILLGLPFLVFGLNGFFHFMEPPPQPPEAQAFLGALEASGYMMVMVKVVEVLCGALLILGRYVPLALTLLAPILVNIVGYHVYIDPAGLPLALAIIALELFCAWAYRARFAPMLAGDAQPLEA